MPSGWHPKIHSFGWFCPRLLEPLLRSDQHGSAHILLVDCMVQQGKVEAAYQLARREADTYPESAISWAALGIALRASGDERGSKEALLKARAIDPESEWIAWALEEAGGDPMSRSDTPPV